VRKCWSKKWVVWWALSVNSQKTKIIFYCTESESVNNKMLFKQWRKVALLRKTLSIELRISLYRTYSVYTWLNNDWTLKKKLDWCSLIITILLIRNVTECLYILSNCDKCHMNNSWKDHWQSFLKPLSISERIWQKIFIDFVINLLSSEGCINLLMITDHLSKKVILKLCKEMTAEWMT